MLSQLTDKDSLIIKIAILEELGMLREKIGNYKFIHVICNDKFTASIANFICDQFNPEEHCIVVIGGNSYETFPLPKRENIFSSITPECLTVTNKTQKYIFHGLYIPLVLQYLYEHSEILSIAYWVPWGGDVYEDWKQEPHQFKIIKSKFQGIMGSAKVKEVYEKRYGPIKQYFPASFSYESIPYKLIVNTPVPKKQYIQIMVNNSAHETTIPALQMLGKFKDQNIRVTTILSYGRKEWNNDICKVGEKLFGQKFMPVLKYIPPEQYIKFLARNDIYIMNHQRPQGMTTCFTAMILGQKIFMPAETNGYLLEEGYRLYNTEDIDSLGFEAFCAHEGIEENRKKAQHKFDKEYIKSCWQKLFDA